MPTVSFSTLGCKVNQYETQRILESFENAGYEVVPFGEEADVYVINTCSVTGQAESKSRQTIRKAARTNSDAVVIATGCAAQMAINQQKALDSAHLVVPNPNKLDTYSFFAARFPERVASVTKGKDIRNSHSRARVTIKIQDGCSVHCSYCSIPYTRPGMVSRPYQEILQEIRAYSRRGYKEVILTGVLIGAYGPDTGSGGPVLEDLIAMISDVNGIERIRISSIEMTQVTDRLIEMMVSDESKVVPHLHIPLQSGSNKVLRDMNRPYTQSDYLRLCRDLLRVVPRLGITTDIMVGFPTETEEDFLETLYVCEEVRYAKSHLFRFSPRPGTEADQWGDQNSPETKQARIKKLLEVTTKTQVEFIDRFIGSTLNVLFERKSKNGGIVGHAENYIEVECLGEESLVGSCCDVLIESREGCLAKGAIIAITSPNRSLNLLPIKE